MSYDPNQFTKASNRYIGEALEKAQESKHIELTPYHLAWALLTDATGLGLRIANKAGVQSSAVRAALEALMKKLTTQDPPPEIHPNARFMAVLRAAKNLKEKSGDSHVAADHMLLALFDDKEVAKALEGVGLTRKLAEKEIQGVRGERKVTNQNAEQTYEALSKYGHDIVKAAEEGKLDPVIGRDEEIRRVVQVLSRRTKNNPVLIGEPGVGKTAIVEGLAQRIVKGDVPNTLNCRVISLDMGALIAGASHRGEFEDRLKAVLKEVQDAAGKIILFIDEIHLVLGAGSSGSGAMDAANLLKPMLARGELRCIGATTLEEYRKYVEKDPAFERRFQQVLVKEPSVADTVSILRGLKPRYESHHGVRIQDAALVVAAQLANRYIQNRFLPDKAIDLVDEACASTRVQLDSQPEIIDQLERRELQLEVEATALEAEKDESSKVRLQLVKEDLTKIREQLKPLRMQHEAEKGRVDNLRNLQKKLEATIQKMQQAERDKNLSLVADLKYGAIPELEKKIAQMEEKLATDDASVPDEKKLLSEVVTPDKIGEIVAKWTGIPVTKLNQTEKERLLKLGAQLHRKVVGQDEAVEAVAEAVLRSRAGLARPSQPTGSFMFLGPTGVGKTELAKALAEELFDSQKAMIRIDMSEFMEQHAVARLIGAPPGYVGHDEGGQLTEAVRRQPYSVILFDEVEKAHPSVFNVLLQTLDDGRLTDGKGRTVDFTNTIIIMTSNLGSEFLLKGTDMKTGQLQPGVKERVMEEVKKHFRPEFLNRLDDIVVFHSLSQRELGSIVQMQLQSLATRLDDRDITLKLTDAAAQWILSQSYDPHYGARPLRRYLEKHVVTEISRLLIKGELVSNALVTIDAAGDGRLSFRIQATEPKSKRKSSTASSNLNSSDRKSADSPTAMDTSSDDVASSSSSSSSSSSRGGGKPAAKQPTVAKDDSRADPKRRRVDGR